MYCTHAHRRREAGTGTPLQQSEVERWENGHNRFHDTSAGEGKTALATTSEGRHPPPTRSSSTPLTPTRIDPRLRPLMAPSYL